jgi:heme/copper-type cytochrome/quinol oxidase subunit 2
MSLIASIAAETAVASFNATPFIAAGTAFAVFLTLGIVAWSYRDVYNRHNDKTSTNSGEHDSHSAGH